MTTYEEIHAEHEMLRNTALAYKNINNKGLLIGVPAITEFMPKCLDIEMPVNGITISVGGIKPTWGHIDYIGKKLTTIYGNMDELINPRHLPYPPCIFKNWIIAGGSIVAYLTHHGSLNPPPYTNIGKPNMDIDFFPKSNNIIESDLKEITEFFLRYGARVFETTYSLTVYMRNRYPLQFIKASFVGGSIGNLLFPFDLSIAGFAFDFDNDIIYATKEAVLEIMYRTIYMYHSRLSSNYESRALRYMMVKHIALCIPGINHQFIDRKIANGINKIIGTVHKLNSNFINPYIDETSMYLDNNATEIIPKYLNIRDPNKKWHYRVRNGSLEKAIKRYISDKLLNETIQQLSVKSLVIHINDDRTVEIDTLCLVSIPYDVRKQYISGNLNQLMNDIENNYMSLELFRFCNKHNIRPIQILKHSWDGTLSTGVPIDNKQYTIDLQRKVINDAKYRYNSWWCLNVSSDTFGNILPPELCRIIVDYSADAFIIKYND